VGDLLFQWNTITQLDTLLSGVLLALILERPGVADSARRVAGWLSIPLALGWLWLLSRTDLAKENVTSKTLDFVWLWLLGAGVVGSLVVRRGWVHRLLAHRWLVWLGRISYGLYMYHEITLWLGRSFFGAIGWFPNKEILTTLGCLGLTVGAAAASYYGLERPFLRWKRSWTRVPSRPV
jgi:peptidoglycan/LPS O-acetylase OafA/YrhL